MQSCTLVLGKIASAASRRIQQDDYYAFGKRTESFKKIEASERR